MARKPSALAAPNPQQLKAQQALAVPGALADVLAHVSMGGSVPEWAEARGISAGHVFVWIHADPERDRMYTKALSDRLEWAKETIWSEVRKMAFFDVRSLFTAEGRLKPIDQWPADAAAAVSGLEAQELFTGKGDDRELAGFVKKVRLTDRTRSLELLGKQVGMFGDVVEHKGEITLSHLVAQARAKVIEGSKA